MVRGMTHTQSKWFADMSDILQMQLLLNERKRLHFHWSHPQEGKIQLFDICNPLVKTESHNIYN